MNLKSFVLAGGVAVAMGSYIGADAALLTYTTGLDVWLDAQDIDGNDDGNSETNGAAVATWVNKGSGGNATVGVLGGTPTYGKGNGPLTGQDAIAFNGSDQSYQLPEFMDSDTFSIFVVAKLTGGLGAKDIFRDYGSVTNKQVSFMADYASFNAQVRDNGDPREEITAGGGTLFDNTWGRGLVILSSDGGSPEAFTLEAGEVGSTTTGTNANYGSTTWDGIYRAPHIGGYFFNVHVFGGYMAEILIYDRAVTGDDRDNVLGYLQAKYVIPEPSTFVLLAMGALGLLVWRRKRRHG